MEMGKEKIVVVVMVSFIVLSGFSFLVQKGVSSGMASYTWKNLSLEEFKPLVKQVLETKLVQAKFYPLLPPTKLCVQVAKNEKESVSFEVVKTAKDHTIQEKAKPCDNSPDEDFAVKFNSGEAFYSLANNLNCKNMRNSHKKGFVVLPSKYVLSGFKSDSSLDYTPFCKLASGCLSSTERLLLKIKCS